MPQKFINNFDAVTAFAIGPDDDDLGISDLLSGASLARITSLVSGTGDWVELVLIGEAGAVENIRFDFAGNVQRDYSESNAGTPAWPLGSRLIAPYSAAAAGAAKAATRPIAASTGGVLELSPMGVYDWSPAPGIVTIDNTSLDSELGGDYVLTAAEVLLSAPNVQPMVINILSAPRYVKLPPGGSGLYNTENFSYLITLQPANKYRLRFSGVRNDWTLDVSDHSEYQAIG